MGDRRTWSTVEFVRKSWPDGEVVYNLSSGNTHLVSSLAAHILDQLSQRPTDSTEIAGNLAAENGVEVADDLITSVEELLATLEVLGLVEVSIQ